MRYLICFFIFISIDLIGQTAGDGRARRLHNIANSGGAEYINIAVVRAAGKNVTVPPMNVFLNIFAKDHEKIVLSNSELDNIQQQALIDAFFAMKTAPDYAVHVFAAAYNQVISEMYRQGYSIDSNINALNRLDAVRNDEIAWQNEYSKLDPNLARGILLTSWSKRPNYDPEGGFESWLVAQALNRLKDPQDMLAWFHEFAGGSALGARNLNFLPPILEVLLKGQYDVADYCRMHSLLGLFFQRIGMLAIDRGPEAQAVIEQSKKAIDRLQAIPSQMKHEKCDSHSMNFTLNEVIERAKETLNESFALARGTGPNFNNPELSSVPAKPNNQCDQSDFYRQISTLFTETDLSNHFLSGFSDTRGCNYSIYTFRLSKSRVRVKVALYSFKKYEVKQFDADNGKIKSALLSLKFN